jgi:hypothetical protein
MNKNTLKFCANILSRMDKENSKRNIIYKYGVDLANYQDDYYSCLMDSLLFILGDESFKDDIEWYIFEKPNQEERFYFIDGKKISVEDPLAFLEINYNLKN